MRCTVVLPKIRALQTCCDAPLVVHITRYTMRALKLHRLHCKLHLVLLRTCCVVGARHKRSNSLNGSVESN